MNLINELRMLAEDLHVNGYNRYSAAMSKAAAVFGHLGGTPDECGNAIIAARDELLDRLEAAEKERESWKGVAQQFGNDADELRTHLSFAKDELNRLRAKIAEMERQEPVATVRINVINGNPSVDFVPGHHYLHHNDKLCLAPGAQPAPSVPDDMVERAVTRFLSWKLPKDFHPDGGVVFIPTKGRGYDSPHWPCGTNLLNAQQARDMLRHVLAAAPEAK